MLLLRTLDGLTPAGAETRIVLSFDAPYAAGNSFRPVQITGLDYEYAPPAMAGWDPLQALLASISICASLLDDFILRGGKLYYPESEDEYDVAQFAIKYRPNPET